MAVKPPDVRADGSGSKLLDAAHHQLTSVRQGQAAVVLPLQQAGQDHARCHVALRRREKGQGKREKG